MKALKKFANGAMYVALSVVLFFQVLGLIGTSLSDVTALKESKWLIPVWIGAVYLIGMGIVLCKVWKKKEKLSLIPLILSVVGAVLALLVALTLQGALPPIYSNGVSLNGWQGLNGWRLFWRHYSLVLVAVITAIVAFIHYKVLRGDRIRRENEAYQEAFRFEDELSLTEEKSSKKTGKKARKNG